MVHIFSFHPCLLLSWFYPYKLAHSFNLCMFYHFLSAVHFILRVDAILILYYVPRLYNTFLFIYVCLCLGFGLTNSPLFLVSVVSSVFSFYLLLYKFIPFQMLCISKAFSYLLLSCSSWYFVNFLPVLWVKTMLIFLLLFVVILWYPYPLLLLVILFLYCLTCSQYELGVCVNEIWELSLLLLDINIC